MIIHAPEIKKMIYEAYPNLSGLAKAYVEGLDNVVALYTNTIEEIIRRQCAQIYLYLEPEPGNEQQLLVKQKMLEISHEIESRENSDKPLSDILSEEEASEIMACFEKETSHKFKKGEKITLEDHIRFAKKYGYSIGKVLLASAWLDEYLSSKDIAARNAIHEDITVAG